MRVNVYVPDELWQLARTQLPDTNWSRVMRDRLVELLDCDHERLVCSCCDSELDADEVRLDGVERFWRQLAGVLDDVAARAGSAAGAANAVHRFAAELGITAAANRRAARPTRAELIDAGRSRHCA